MTCLRCSFFESAPMKSSLISWCLFFSVFLFHQQTFLIGVLALPNTDEAYVTLLYGDEFLLGVRVLGKSIRNNRSTIKDMVVLVSDGVSSYTKSLLRADGWIVEQISLLTNPNHVSPKRFWGVYTKLKIFNMTDYKKVVYLDADTIVVKNIEVLFKCGKFCANLKHSERLNSGVMVLEPSEKVFNDMMNQVNSLYSYTGGDQGFLNSYYADFPNAPLFEPNLSPAERNSRPIPEMERLSTLYNADVGLYMLANKWMVDEKELCVIHYTLGPLKPWDWWTSWLVKPVDVWQEIRQQLEDSLPGTGGGRNPDDLLVVNILFLLPLVFLVFCFYQSNLQWRDLNLFLRSSLQNQIRNIYYKVKSGGLQPYVVLLSSSAIDSYQQSSSGLQSKTPSYLGGLSIAICFLIAVVAIGLSFSIIPRQVMPWTGLLLTYEYTFIIFFVLFAVYLHLVRRWGKLVGTQIGSSSLRSDSLEYDSGKGHQQNASLCDRATWFYGLGMAFLAVVAPSLPCLFGITALFLRYFILFEGSEICTTYQSLGMLNRLGLMVVGGIILAAFMTYAAEHLAIGAFRRGLEDRGTQWNRNLCSL
ncbi:Glycosyl transferase, family 8, partial [Dillenia turbinata]